MALLFVDSKPTRTTAQWVACQTSQQVYYTGHKGLLVCSRETEEQPVGRVMYIPMLMGRKALQVWASKRETRVSRLSLSWVLCVQHTS